MATSTFSRLGTTTVQLLAPQCTQLPSLANRVKMVSIIGLILSVIVLVVAIMTYMAVKKDADSTTTGGSGTVTAGGTTPAASGTTDDDKHKKLKMYAVAGIVIGVVELLISGWGFLLGTRISSCLTSGTTN